jgi:hypothetical protein
MELNDMKQLGSEGHLKTPNAAMCCRRCMCPLSS